MVKKIAARTKLETSNDVGGACASTLNILPDNSANQASYEPSGMRNLGNQTKWDDAAKGNQTTERAVELVTKPDCMEL